jgi:catechol 2,3-dioxygenase-like lactoylglutathione lyase family enzyme
MNIKIYVVCLFVEDVQAAARFYREVIGLPELKYHTGDSPHFDLGGSFLTIRSGLPAFPSKAEDRFPILAFSTSNLDAAMDRLRIHAIEMPWGVETNSASRWVMFHDPAGNLIEFVELNN